MANTFVFDDDESQPAAEPPESDSPEPDKPEGGEGNNRNFLIAAVVLGGIVLLSLICMAAYALYFMPRQQASAKETSVSNAAAGTQAAFVQVQTQEAALFTATPSPTDTEAPLPTETLVVVFASATPSVVPTLDPATATVGALQTQLAISQATADGTKSASISGTPGTPGTPGKNQLAKTGFADEVGLPGLFMAALIVIAIILLARRLRQAPR